MKYLRVSVDDDGDQHDKNEGNNEEIVLDVAVPTFRFRKIEFVHVIAVLFQRNGRFSQMFINFVVDKMHPFNKPGTRVEIGGDGVHFEQAAKVTGDIVVGDKFVKVVEKPVMHFFADTVRVFWIVGSDRVEEHPIVWPPDGRVHYVVK